MHKRPQSPWLKMRAVHLKTYPECRVCGRVDKSNHVHHLRYRGQRGVDEQPGDLVTLCADDHNAFHKKFGRSGFHVKDALRWVEEARAAHALVVELFMD